jgi:hypothetical protein
MGVWKFIVCADASKAAAPGMGESAYWSIDWIEAS